MYGNSSIANDDNNWQLKSKSLDSFCPRSGLKSQSYTRRKVGFEKMGELQARVASEIKTTFASTYTQEVSLEEVLTLESLMVYAKQATGEKFLINPNAKKIT